MAPSLNESSPVVAFTSFAVRTRLAPVRSSKGQYPFGWSVAAGAPYMSRRTPGPRSAFAHTASASMLPSTGWSAVPSASFARSAQPSRTAPPP